MERWDVIVVGAGSAGAPISARLAASGRRVLLLEAGPDYRSAELPEVWRSANPFRALLDPAAPRELAWLDLLATRTDVQEPALYWRGKGVGGSSTINGQIAIRPPVEDFDDWASAGCTGWSWDEVLPFFNKSESDSQFGDRSYHGDKGPIPVHRTSAKSWGAVDSALHAAAIEAGHPWSEDVNAPGAMGVSPYPINSWEGSRVTVNDVYVEPSRMSENFAIRGGALVDRVLFENGKAVGVRYLADGTTPVDVGADMVVLSAGAIHSPAILQRSGVGPQRLLRAHDIPIIADLPVGYGLQDHPMTAVLIPLKEESTVRTQDDRHTNVCVRYSSGHPGGSPLDMMLVAFNQNVFPIENKDYRFGVGGFGAWLNKPWSRGAVMASSADPAIQPEIREAMLSDPRDLDRLRAGVRHLVDLACSSAVAEVADGSISRINPTLFSVLDDDRRLDAFLLATAADAQHATSTCRLGNTSEAETVVDPDCKVLGLDGLRVVDASIFPSIPRANTHLATVMLGEMMAHRILTQ
ncbi:GMC family oxidoreductase [Streptomyces sp. NPDC088788]|uniref:GMC family oxidoreductase n=1 Tax=Streptomyces sp. NPDC088788 TaxID=3365898 RepID=UPI0037F555EA